jgi:predicted permease
MSWLTWIRRRKWEREMDSEMMFHVESQTHDYIRQGMSRGEAERLARREFGALELAKDECRDQRGFAWIDYLRRDVSFAIRSLRKTPGFTLAAILTLALGIGANTGIFSVIYAVLLKPLPYRDADRIFTSQVELAARRGPEGFGRLAGTIQQYLEWRTKGTLFSDVAAVQPGRWNVAGDGEPERIEGAVVSTNFFSFLGVPVALGREFLPEEETPGKDKVVVISDSLWRRRFAADAAILGKKINLQGEPHEIVGVAPASMAMPAGPIMYFHFSPRIDIWKPQAPTKEDLQGESWNQMLLLRLKSAENIESGREQLRALLNPPGWQRPGRSELIPYLVPIRDVFTSNVRLRLLLLVGASQLLLLIACTNIASLLLSRTASRSSEFAIRIALGAKRSRILTHLLAESTLLALAGGLIAVGFAAAAVRLLTEHGPADMPFLSQVRMKVPVLLFTVLVSIITGFICGVVPAWKAYRKDAAASLQEGARAALGGSRAAAIRQVLMGVQIGLATALLASAALLLHSFVKVVGADRGYEIENVMTVPLFPVVQGARRVDFFRTLTDDIRSIPGVIGAGAIGGIPVRGDAGSQVIYRGDDVNETVFLQRPIAGFRNTTPGYFAASGSTLLAGRFFTEHDPVTTAVVSESLAILLWPGEPLNQIPGRTVYQGNVQSPLISVVGVIRDVRPGAVDKRILPQIYRPYLPPRTFGDMTLVIRTSVAPSALVPAIRAAIRKADANIPIPAIQTMQEIVSSTVAERQFQMALTVLFAIVALFLAAIGVYGVVSYAVTCRTRDIGLRIALGAIRQEILRWVMAKGMLPVFIGLIAGSAAALAAATALRSLLYGISPYDPVALTGVAIVLLATAFCACYLPARRASRLDPMIALRHE